MSKVVDHQDAFAWSVNKIATAFGVDRRTVGKRLQECNTQASGSKQGHPTYQLGDAARAVFGKEGAPTGPQDWDQFPEARKAWYQSENERLKFEVSTNQLIPETDVARAIASMIKAVAAGLDSLPDILERDAGLDPDSLILVTEVIDGLRARMAEDVRAGVADDS